MKLIKQTRLHFQDGGSDKVYEVDLCEVGDNQYVVNFRYGRRGASLSEGTKTVAAVDLKKAEGLFDKLVEEKSKKGYVDVSEGSIVQQGENIETEKAEKIVYATPEEAMEAHILTHLQLAAKSMDLQAKKNWDIKRVVWRAGELKLAAAVPHLIRLAALSQLGKKKTDLYQYCILWALGRCAPKGEWVKESLELIDAMLRSEKSTDLTRRMASEAYLAIAEGNSKAVFLDAVLSSLKPELQEAVKNDDYRLVRSQLLAAKQQKGSSTTNNFFAAGNPQQAGLSILTPLYMLSLEKPQTRRALLEVVAELPLEGGYFKYLRQLFKTAEFREDGQMFGILAYRIEKQPAVFKMPSGSNPGFYHKNQYLYPKAELKKEDAKLAFSEKTKSYLQRRIRRTLQELGNNKNPNYVLFATGILLQYDDSKDGQTSRISKDWVYDNDERRWMSSVNYFDSYSKELLFNQILYTNSERYGYSKRHSEWLCINGYEPGTAIDNSKREEAFPELWDTMPKALFHLLIESKSEKVSEFALRNLRRLPDFKQYLSRFDAALTIRLLEKSLPTANLFALELARQLYNPEKPDSKLVLAMLNHKNVVIREQAMAWITQGYYIFFTDVDFVRDVLTHNEAQIRKWAAENFDRIAELYDEQKRKALIARLLGYCLRDAKDASMIQEITTVLLKYFSEELSHISIDIIGDLLKHTHPFNKYFAADLFLNHNIAPERIPMDNILLLINSNDERLRTAGLELLKRWPDVALGKQQELLLSLFASAIAELRATVRPVIARLAAQHEDFAKSAIVKLVKILLRKEAYEGQHADTAAILSVDLEKWLFIIERQLIFRLLNSEHSQAQEFACILIERYVPASSLSVRNIIRLSEHEILAARRLSWKMFEEQLPRIKYEREESVRLMDSTWEDSRQFAFEFFRRQFTDADWTPELLVSICDSVRNDVQAFGRELITKFFKTEDGPDYLLKLSQHPKAEVQLFATNYLERFAADNIHNIKKLEIFFITVLSNVNKGRVAKDRVLLFLHKEALKSFEAAEVVARIVDRISATFAKGDKAACIEIMRDIQQKYPVIDLPISINEFPEYEGV